MLKYLLLALATCQAVEFSSRPTNTTITLLYFTQVATGTTTVLAPYGLWTLMAGLSYGSTQDTTRQIFRAFLLLTDRKKFTSEFKSLKTAVFEPTSGVTLMNQNFFFVDNSFREIIVDDFRNMMVSDFDTAFNVIDFEDPSAARIANLYLKNLDFRVPNVLRPDDFISTSVVMGNVLFFNASWSLPFKIEETRSENGKEVLYQRANVPYSHIDAMQASVMELFYGNDKKFSMLIIIPDPGINVIMVYKNFVRVTIRDIFANLDMNTKDFGLKEIDIELPKLTRVKNLILNRPLNDMGIYDAFDPEYAQFNKMVREPIFIDTIETSVTLILNEQGTIAYATVPGRRDDIKNDKNEQISPRILFIVEKTTATLLFGAILT